MKIAIIGHKRIPSNEGGIEKGVEQHAVRMVKEEMMSQYITVAVTMFLEKNLMARS